MTLLIVKPPLVMYIIAFVMMFGKRVGKNWYLFINVITFLTMVSDIPTKLYWKYKSSWNRFGSAEMKRAERFG